MCMYVLYLQFMFEIQDGEMFNFFHSETRIQLQGIHHYNDTESLDCHEYIDEGTEVTTVYRYMTLYVENKQ